MTTYIIKEDINNASYSLIYMFIFAFILAIFVYVCYMLSEYPGNIVHLSEADYKLFETDSNQPDNNLLGVENPNKPVDWRKLNAYSALNRCAKGKCAVDLNTGVKRCPADPASDIIYTPDFEVCSQKNSCTATELPFALHSTGEATTNMCEKDIACRCLVNPQCAANVVSTFVNTDGSPYGVNNEQLNYSFIINVDNEEEFSRESIILNDDEFCKLNPAFTERIVNGCNFNNSITDPIDCENVNSYVLLQDDEVFSGVLIGTLNPPSAAPTFDGHGDITYPTDSTVGDLSMVVQTYSSQKGSNVKDQIKPVNTKDIYTFKYGGTSWQIFYKNYGTTTQYQELSGRWNNTYTFKNIYSRKSPEADYTIGFPVTINNAAKQNIVITSTKFVPQNCINSGLGVNYKNMLVCLQDDNQPCRKGNLAYNIDKSLGGESINSEQNPRNFCHGFDKKRLEITNVQQFYLNDPSSFTTSCVIGAGCGMLFDINLCTDDCIAAIKHHKDKFYDIYDDSAVSNTWYLNSNQKYTGNYTISGGTLTINTSEQLFTLQEGDYWSVDNNIIFKYIKNDTEATAIEIELLNTTGLEPGMSASYSGVAPVQPGIVSIYKNTVTLDKELNSVLRANTPITFASPFIDNSFGIIGKPVPPNNDNSNKYYLLDITGTQIIKDQHINTKVNSNMVIFKQFGFNGINYNTKIRNNQPAARFYSHSWKFAEFVIFNGLNIDNGVSPVYGFSSLNAITNNNLSIEDYSKSSFNDPNAEFKKSINMYYPVWNDAVFKQECVMCRPGFFSYTTVNSNYNIKSASIQFSSKDFYNYIYYQPSDSYVYTTFSKVKSVASLDQLQTTTNYLILEETNNNIEIGDYVLDSEGLMQRHFITSKANLTITPGTNINLNNINNHTGTTQWKSVLPENRYTPFKIIDNKGVEIIFDTSPKKISSTSSNTLEFDFGVYGPNYFCGPEYSFLDTSKIINTANLIPVVKVKEIRPGNVIITDSVISKTLKDGAMIQFIKSSENLTLEVVQDVDQTSQSTGSGGKVNVTAISDGRITGMSITNIGQNYRSDNNPTIIVNNYFETSEINKITY